MQSHGQLPCFILLHISNSSVSTSLVGHVLYLADLMSAICFPHLFLMVHRYIYIRYSPVFLMLYQLYYSLPFSTLTLFSSLYLSIATWVTPQGCNKYQSPQNVIGINWKVFLRAFCSHWDHENCQRIDGDMDK